MRRSIKLLLLTTVFSLFGCAESGTAAAEAADPTFAEDALVLELGGDQPLLEESLTEIESAAGGR